MTEKVSNIVEGPYFQSVDTLLVGDVFRIPQSPGLVFKLCAKSPTECVVQALTGQQAGEYTNALPNFQVIKETVH